MNGLRVVGRGAVFQYKGKQLDSREVGRQLNATHVLEGSVRRSGDQLRISAQLVNAVRRVQLLVADLRPPVEGRLRHPTGDRRGDRGSAQAPVVGAARAGAGAALYRNLEVYNLYLQGLYQWNRYSEEGLKKAVVDFQQAIDTDPGYAPAYAMLSSVYALMGYYQMAPPDEMWPLAKQAAEKSISIAASLPEAHASLGFVLGLQEHHWKDSETEHQESARTESGERRGSRRPTRSPA